MKAWDCTFLLKESKVHSTNNHNLQCNRAKKYFSTLILHTGLETVWYWENTGKWAFCLTFLTHENTLMHVGQEWRCLNEVNIVLNKQFPLGLSFCTSLEPRVVWMKPRLKYTIENVQQWPLASHFSYSITLHCKCNWSQHVKHTCPSTQQELLSSQPFNKTKLKVH